MYINHIHPSTKRPALDILFKLFHDKPKKTREEGIVKLPNIFCGVLWKFLLIYSEITMIVTIRKYNPKLNLLKRTLGNSMMLHS